MVIALHIIVVDLQREGGDNQQMVIKQLFSEL